MSTDSVPDRDNTADIAESVRSRPGPALARAALDAARGARRKRALGGGRREGENESGDVPSRVGGYSGARADERDPQLLGSEITRLFRKRGWEQTYIQAQIFGAWERLVGADIAMKCHPVSLSDGELVVAAISTAWATQLRMLAAKMLARMHRELGNAGGRCDTVRVIRVHGPVGPSWKHGMRSAPGRGPRDTYG